MFCDRMYVEKPQRVPPFSSSALWDFSAPVGPFFSHFFEYVIFFLKFFFEKFSIFEYCNREYLILGSLFAIFEPWIWRRLGPVPACFSPNGSPFDFDEVPPRNSRSEALYPNFGRYIQTILCFSKEVRKQEFFMKTSYTYFKNCAF